MLCQFPSNCLDTVWQDVKPNPDISGIGITVGFIASAWAVFFLLAFRYIAVTPEASTTHDSPQSLDGSLRPVLRKLFGKNWSPQWAPTLEGIVLAMSDQQLVTGLSIVISAYVRLQRDLSFYHWRMITTLAWFSSATHLATLLFLRQHMQSNRYIWYARALLMFGLALMVALAIIPTGVPVSMDPSEDDQVDQKVTLGMPARCALSCINPEIFDFEDGTMMLLSEIILLGALCARLLGIFSSIEGFSIRPILGRLWRRPLLWSCDRLQSSSKRAQALLLPPLVLHLSAGISMKATLDIIGSDVGGLIWLVYSLIWGTNRVFYTRHVSEENEWGFGQLVPIVLLLLPALLMAEGFSDVGSKNQRPAVLDSIAGHNTSFQSLGSQQPIELTPKISTERRDDGGRNDDPFVHHMAPNTGLLPNTKRPDNRLWVRIRDICMQDFRAEPWYLSNLWLMALVAVASACMTFPEALTRGNDLDHAVVMLVILPIIYFSTSSIIIPLCGIVNSIRDTTLSSRNPLSGIRLAIDPGKRYHAIRWIYFALLSMATGFTAYVGLPMHLYLAVPPIACCIVFGPALFTELFSIIFQVLGED